MMSPLPDDLRLAVAMLNGLELQGRARTSSRSQPSPCLTAPPSSSDCAERGRSGITIGRSIQLRMLAGQLERAYPGAGESLREGIEETLTLARLGVTGQLERTLESTNFCKSMIEMSAAPSAT